MGARLMASILAVSIACSFFTAGCAASQTQAKGDGAAVESATVEAESPDTPRQAAAPEATADPAEQSNVPQEVFSQSLAYIAGRVDESARRVYVYKDFAAGQNNFTQKAFMGNHYDSPPTMDEKAAPCEGISSMRAHIDLSQFTWGGYMLVEGKKASGEQEPQAAFGELQTGMDLSGASRLVFYAKGEKGGERIEFFAAGLGYGETSTEAHPDSSRKITNGYVTLSDEWQRYEMDVAGYDLSDIGCGFGWVTNDVNNYPETDVAFYMDEIYYEFDQPRQAPVFLQSYASVLDDTDEYVINNFAYTYDNALAVLALSYGGYDAQATRIADALVYALYSDRYFTDGRLRNAYMAGDPRSPLAWLSGREQRYARIPGFYDTADSTWKEDAYAVSTSAGNMAWAVLALLEVYETSGSEAYLMAAQDMGTFLLTLKSESGGFLAGYEGWEGEQSQATYKSTEHNIDLVPVFAKLAVQQEDAAQAAAYEEASAWAKNFVLSMYDGDAHCFYTGTGADGVTVNKDVLPLDTNTWGLMALYPQDFEDAPAVMEFVQQAFAVEGGYDFNDDKDGVWYEGTAQVALVHSLMGDAQKYGEVLEFLLAARAPDGSITAADRDGVSTGFMVSGLDIPWNYSARTHLGATAWLALAEMQRNPLASG